MSHNILSEFTEEAISIEDILDLCIGDFVN